MSENHQIVLPGEVISETTENLMCGSGVAIRDGKIISTVRGYVTQISQLLSVTPITSIYSPNVGDVVVGRIAQVLKQRWKVKIGCSVLATLRLSSIYLPDEQFRRRTTADERNMRQYFDVGDIICAEVQQIQADGLVFLHTRQQHPRRLENGMTIEVSSRLIKRVQFNISVMKIDGFDFNCIFGLNGVIWISPKDVGSIHMIPRIRNCFILLATYNQLISVESIQEVYQLTSELEVSKIVTEETAKSLGFI